MESLAAASPMASACAFPAAPRTVAAQAASEACLAAADPTEGGGTKTVPRSRTMPTARLRERAALLPRARAMALTAVMRRGGRSPQNRRVAVC